MSKLYIHIGFHKTGSTSLQYALQHSTEELLLSGVRFVSGNVSGNSSDFVTINAHGSRVQATVSKAFFEMLEVGLGGNAIISAEHLSLIEDVQEIRKLERYVKRYYDEVVIVAYVRRQDKLSISFKQQAAKQAHRGASPSSLLCGHDHTKPLPDLHWTLLNYLQFYKKYQLWSEVFGASNVFFRVYDRAFLEEGCICKDFSFLLGMKYGMKSFSVNEGFGVVKTYLKHYLIEKKAPELLARLVNGVSIDNADFELREQFLDSSSFMEPFIAGNKKLPLNDFQIASLTRWDSIAYRIPVEKPGILLTQLLTRHEPRVTEIMKNFLSFIKINDPDSFSHRSATKISSSSALPGRQ